MCSRIVKLYEAEGCSRGEGMVAIGAPRYARRPLGVAPNCLSSAAPVFAYLDPGTGSMLVQLLVGGVAAVGVTLKLYWHRILRLLRIRKPEPEPDRER